MRTKSILQYEEQFFKVYVDIRETGAIYSRNVYKKDDNKGKIRFRLNDEVR